MRGAGSRVLASSRYWRAAAVQMHRGGRYRRARAHDCAGARRIGDDRRLQPLPHANRPRGGSDEPHVTIGVRTGETEHNLARPDWEITGTRGGGALQAYACCTQLSVSAPVEAALGLPCSERVYRSPIGVIRPAAAGPSRQAGWQASALVRPSIVHSDHRKDRRYQRKLQRAAGSGFFRKQMHEYVLTKRKCSTGEQGETACYEQYSRVLAAPPGSSAHPLGAFLAPIWVRDRPDLREDREGEVARSPDGGRVGRQG